MGFSINGLSLRYGNLPKFKGQGSVFKRNIDSGTWTFCKTNQSQFQANIWSLILIICPRKHPSNSKFSKIKYFIFILFIYFILYYFIVYYLVRYYLYIILLYTGLLKIGTRLCIEFRLKSLFFGKGLFEENTKVPIFWKNAQNEFLK